MENRAESVAKAWLKNHVHVVWHDAPGEQSVAITVEVWQCVLNHRGNVGASQPTCAQSSVELSVDLSDRVVLGTQGLGDYSRKAVGEPEGDELHRFR